MRVAEWIQLAFASLLALASWTRPLALRRRLKTTALAIGVITGILAARFTVHFLSPLASSVIRDWVPAGLLLVPYWQVGQFFTSPNQNLQERLAAFDRRLLKMLLPNSASRSAIAIRLYAEFAYLMVYLLIPLGLAVLYVAGMRQHADYYWEVVPLATYACVAATPFVRALPPRMLTGYTGFDARPTRIRSLNQWMLRYGSIQAITFPSAHVAASVAASLVLLQLLPWVGVVIIWLALSIAIGAIVGGYHYVADVLLAPVVALLVFVGIRWW
jgi:hypothetical protein